MKAKEMMRFATIVAFALLTSGAAVWAADPSCVGRPDGGPYSGTSDITGVGSGNSGRGIPEILARLSVS